MSSATLDTPLLARVLRSSSNATAVPKGHVAAQTGDTVMGSQTPWPADRPHAHISSDVLLPPSYGPSRTLGKRRYCRTHSSAAVLANPIGRKTGDNLGLSPKSPKNAELGIPQEGKSTAIRGTFPSPENAPARIFNNSSLSARAEQELSPVGAASQPAVALRSEARADEQPTKINVASHAPDHAAVTGPLGPLSSPWRGSVRSTTGSFGPPGACATPSVRLSVQQRGGVDRTFVTGQLGPRVNVSTTRKQLTHLNHQGVINTEDVPNEHVAITDSSKSLGSTLFDRSSPVTGPLWPRRIISAPPHHDERTCLASSLWDIFVDVLPYSEFGSTVSYLDDDTRGEFRIHTIEQWAKLSVGHLRMGLSVWNKMSAFVHARGLPPLPANPVLLALWLKQRLAAGPTAAQRAYSGLRFLEIRFGVSFHTKLPCILSLIHI